jgi:protein ImuB
MAGRPLALVEAIRDNAPLVAINDYARQAGVEPDMTVSRARARCPELVVQPKSNLVERRETDSLIEHLLTVSPFVEAGEDGSFFIDASGLKRLYKSDLGLVRKIIRLFSQIGYPVKIGIGVNKFVSRVAASVSSVYSFTCVADGEEKDFLKTLSTEHLPVLSDIRERLTDLGLRTIGQVADFSGNEMSGRFGAGGMTLSCHAKGDDAEFFLPELPTVKLSKKLSYAPPLESMTSVLTGIEQTLEEIFDDLDRTGRGCSTLMVNLLLEDRSDRMVDIALNQPAASPRQFIRQLRTRLEKTRLPWAVTDIIVTLGEIVSLHGRQLQLNRTMTAIDGRLRVEDFTDSRFDKNALLTPVLNRAMVPDGCLQLTPMVTSKNGNGIFPSAFYQNWDYPYALQSVAGLRLIHPARTAEVDIRAGRFYRLRLGPQLSRIVRHRGPWEVSGNWWSDDFERWYYEIETENAQLYLLYFDRRLSGWFMQGIFD